MPDTQGWSLPLRVILMAEGMRNQASPVAMPAAISVEPTPVENMFTAP